MSCVPLDWAHDRASWPHTDCSRFIEAGGVRWHLQDAGEGDAVLLVHGTGASTHSWAGLLPLLVAEGYRAVAVDLPGHGFSSAGPERCATLPGMAQACTELLRTVAVRPALAVGHSAGAAVLARMCVDESIAPRALISLNGALLPLRGLPGQFFAPIARLLATLPLVPALFARHAVNRRLVERLLRDTGSTLPAADVDRYHRLLCTPRHVSAALRMMARWDLEALERRLPRLPVPLHLVACQNDGTVPPAEGARLARLLRDANLYRVAGLGHLGHEEDPARIARLIASIDPARRPP
jgi:magnesium chelatase accessory protein